MHLSHKQCVHCMRFSLEIFPPNISLPPVSRGLTALLSCNEEKHPISMEYREKSEKCSCGTEAEKWSPEISGCFTTAPMGVEIWLHPHAGAATVCTKPSRASCYLGLEASECNTVGSRKKHCTHGTTGKKSQEYKRTCSQLNKTAVRCQENPLSPVQASLRVERSEIEVCHHLYPVPAGIFKHRRGWSGLCLASEGCAEIAINNHQPHVTPQACGNKWTKERAAVV